MTRRWKFGAVAAAMIAALVLIVVEPGDPYRLGLALFLGAVPALLVATWAADRAADNRLAHVVAHLGAGGPAHTVRDALRTALSDPSLELAYVHVGNGGWIDELGAQTMDPARTPGRAFTPIHRGGKPVAGLLHDAALLRRPERLHAAIEAASFAIDNERLKAELRADVRDAQTSRARIVEAGDRELQRLERNLHDGAQQRLVGLALLLRLASRRAAGDAAVAEIIADAARELDDALVELRELTRGIHPAIVVDAGLGGALETLVERPGVPVDLHIELPDRLPEAVEVGAYYLVAEALTNTNKHASARGATVRASVVETALRVVVHDDGIGGAATTAGSGLEGLADRVSGLGGQLVVDSPAGQGTTVSADIPLSFQPVTDVERRRVAALRWIGWENWAAPGELYDQITDEDNFMAAKLMMLCAGGNRQLTEGQRKWLVGYLTAAGDADWVLEAVAAYDDTDTLEEMIRVPGIAAIARGNLYDAMRLCFSDGPLTPDELDRLRRGSDAMGITRDTFDQLHQIVVAEHDLRDRRYGLIVAPVLPQMQGLPSRGSS